MHNETEACRVVRYVRLKKKNLDLLRGERIYVLLRMPETDVFDVIVGLADIETVKNDGLGLDWLFFIEHELLSQLLSITNGLSVIKNIESVIEKYI